MSNPVPPYGHPDDAASLQSLFYEALSKYQSGTGVDLAVHPIANKLKDCVTVDAAIAVFEGELRHTKDVKKRRLVETLKPTVEIILAVVGNGGITGFVGSIFLPGGAILGSIAIILRALKKVGADYDGIIDIYNTVARFLERLRVYISNSPPNLSTILIKTIVEILSISSTITKWVQQGWLKTLGKSFAGSTEITGALKRLDKLTNEELSMAVAEILKAIHTVVRDVSAVKEDVEQNLDTTRTVAAGLTEMQRNELKRRFRDWLSPPNPTTNHHKARNVRHRGSAKWFIQGETFKEWKSAGNLFWIHGKVGSGKTVLCSAIIDDLWPIAVTESATVVYFYCDFQDPAKQDVHGILLSLLIQLCDQSDTYLNILSGLSSSYSSGSPKPGDDILVEWLKYMLALPGNGVKYIIMDALDECPSSGLPTPRVGVMKALEELCELSQTHNLRLCIMSRFEHDIQSVLEPLASHSISLELQRGQAQDMTDYTSSVINSDSQMKGWDTETKDLVTRVLSEKAHGMFRYVHCQLETLRDCHPADIQDALDSLPENLEGTYERILQHIPETKWKYAHRLFQCLTVSSRPLSVVEAAEILAIDFDVDPIPVLHPERRPSGPEASIMSTCSTLVVIVSGDRDSSRMVQFAHMSVQEYLTSDRLVQSASDRVSRYHVIPEVAHSLLAQVCLSTILFDGHKDLDGMKPQGSPLVDYSDRFWASHARVDGVSPLITAALEHFLDPQRPGFDGWMRRTHLDDCPDLKNMDVRLICDDRDDHASSPGSPLYHSALLGIHQLADHLAKSNPQHLNAPHGKSGAPLQAASALGHLDVVRTLLGRGATPNGRGGHYGNALCAASVNGNIDIIHVLLGHGARINDVGARNTTALSMAVQVGNRDVTRVLLARGANADLASSIAASGGSFKSAKLLLECGADVDGRDRRGSTALQVASCTGSLDAVQFLLDHRAGVNAPPGSSGTALHCAVSQGHYDVAELLIENAADVNGLGIEGGTSLQVLSSKGHLGAVEWLLRHGGDPNARIGEEMNPLEAASSHGHIDVVQLLVEHGVNVRSDGAVALLHASSNGHLAAARLLLEKGADPNETSGKSERPLRGASANGHLKIVQLLLERQATIDATSGEEGETALHAASRRGQLQVVKLLIDKGADIDGPGDMQWSTTALHIASVFGHLEVVQLLLDRGATIDAAINIGATALFVASQNGRLEVVQLLLDRGATIDAATNDGPTALFIASRNGHVEVVQLLLDRGATIDAARNDGPTALFIASRNGHVEVVQLLLDRGATIDAALNDGATALSIASQNGHVEVVQLLLDHGATIDAAFNTGATALFVASENGHVEVVQLLLRRGADTSLRDARDKTAMDRASEKGLVEIAQLLSGEHTAVD